MRLPQNEFGIFYSADCYVFLCRYFVYNDDEEEDDVDDEAAGSEAEDVERDEVCIYLY